MTKPKPLLCRMHRLVLRKMTSLHSTGRKKFWWDYSALPRVMRVGMMERLGDGGTYVNESEFLGIRRWAIRPHRHYRFPNIKDGVQLRVFVSREYHRHRTNHGHASFPQPLPTSHHSTSPLGRNTAFPSFRGLWDGRSPRDLWILVRRSPNQKRAAPTAR